MRVTTMLGLGLIGGAYYAHRQRGGELTLDSVKDSLRALCERGADLLSDHEPKTTRGSSDRMKPVDAETFEHADDDLRGLR